MVRRSWAIPDKVNNFQDAESVHNEECDEPPFLTVTCGVPQRIAFEDDSPDYDNDNKRHDAE